MSERLYTTRRDFLANGLTLLSAASTLPIFLGGTVRALGAPQSRRRRVDDEPILVVLQLAGGNDGLNTVIPYEQDPYYQARPRLAVPKDQVLALENGVGLNPAAEGLKELFDEGRMALIQGVGYPNPNRSHFVSMDIWHSADPEQRTHTGWLGRYFDAACKGADPVPTEGVALLQEAPLAMQGERFTPLAFENPSALAWRTGRRDPAAEDAFEVLNNRSGVEEAEVDGEYAAFMQRAALSAMVGAEEIRSAAGRELRGRRRRGRGGRLEQSLQLVARMIAADLPTRVYYVSQGGYDTHTGQEGRHANLLRELGDALSNFLDTLKAQKLSERVLVLTFSEFGRRVRENASGGTDHGAAAPMFLFGDTIKPGVHGDHPSLTRLVNGDLAFQTDFRSVYATVLQQWMKIRPHEVLGRGFKPLRVLER